MVDQIINLLGIIGFSTDSPVTMTELIPYLLHVGIAIGLLVAIIKLFKFFVSLVFGKPRI